MGDYDSHQMGDYDEFESDHSTQSTHLAEKTLGDISKPKVESPSNYEKKRKVKPNSKKRKARGRTKCAWLIKLPAKGGKLNIEFEKFNNALGMSGKRMGTFLGMATRNLIPCTYQNRRPQLLSRCGKNWRNFKVKLTSIVYYRKKHCEGKLYDLFEEEYPSITKEQWVEFVRQKQEESFLKYSTKQKLRRAQLKYPAIVGRKGIVGVIAEMAEEGIIDPPRSEVWKRSRKNKDGVYMDVPTQNLVRRIDEVEMKVSQGKTKLGPQEDVL
ncbi:hypothetical protein ACFE04_004291 [Oxalis oulophora]